MTRFLRNISLKKKFILLFGFIVVVAVFTIVVGTISLEKVKVGGRFYKGIKLKRDAIDELARIRMNVNLVRGLFYAQLYSYDEAVSDNMRLIIKNTNHLFNSLNKKMKKASDDSIYCGSCHSLDRAEQIFSSVKESEAAWRKYTDKLINTALPDIEKGKTDELAALIYGELDTDFYRIMDVTSLPLKTLRGIYPHLVNKLKKESDTLKLEFIVGGLIFIILLATVLFLFLKLIVQPVKNVAYTSERISHGIFDSVVINADSKDEIGEMVSAFNKMTTEISKIVKKIKQHIIRISTSSTDLSTTADTLSKSTDVQANQVEQVVAAATELSQTIMDVASNASDAAEASNEANEVATAGMEIAEDAMKEIKRISEIVANAESTIELLGRRSQEIGEITSVINDIAEQTNLLALNAAIEAARAGENGRGFAVVADEVRKLAEKTAHSTRTISEKIKLIQSEAENSVSTIHISREEVEKGVKYIDMVHQSLQSILKVSVKSNEMIQQIATATEEISSASEEIAQSMHSVSKEITETVEAIKQLRELSMFLSGIADELKTDMSWFRIEDEEPHPSDPNSTEEAMKYGIEDTTHYMKTNIEGYDGNGGNGQVC